MHKEVKCVLIEPARLGIIVLVILFYSLLNYLNCFLDWMVNLQILGITKSPMNRTYVEWAIARTQCMRASRNVECTGVRTPYTRVFRNANSTIPFLLWRTQVLLEHLCTFKILNNLGLDQSLRFLVFLVCSLRKMGSKTHWYSVRTLQSMHEKVQSVLIEFVCLGIVVLVILFYSLLNYLNCFLDWMVNSQIFGITKPPVNRTYIE